MKLTKTYQMKETTKAEGTEKWAKIQNKWNFTQHTTTQSIAANFWHMHTCNVTIISTNPAT